MAKYTASTSTAAFPISRIHTGVFQGWAKRDPRDDQQNTRHHHQDTDQVATGQKGRPATNIAPPNARTRSGAMRVAMAGAANTAIKTSP